MNPANFLIKLISFLFALRTILFINTLVIVFHILVLLQIIPFNIVWGGRLQSVEDMYVFESVSLGVNLLISLVVLRKAEILVYKIPSVVINFLLWVFVVIFFLNTIGNLAAETSLEKIIATPVTLLLSVLFWRVAVQKDSKIIQKD